MHIQNPADLKSWDSSQIEKKKIQFRKRYLEVSNKASNVACRAELGRFPLTIAVNQKIMNYSSYLQSKEIFLMSEDLRHAGKNSFILI